MGVRIAVIEGDGVGHEVVPAAADLLRFLEPEFELVPVEIGYGKWKRVGTAMDDDDLELIGGCDCVFFGAITTPPDPEYKSVLLRLRKEFDLYANIRPYQYSGVHISQYRPVRPFSFTIVRENTEGLYSGIEEITGERATTMRVLTRKGCERIARVACKIAKQEKAEITVVHKANVLKSDIFFKNIAAQTAAQHNIPCSEAYVDAMAYHLILHPERYRVIVTTNLFGDILSDLAASLIGGLGMCPSANLGDEYGLFEPVHGSAPDIAGRGIANPIGAVLSAKMMLEWLGRYKSAALLRRAVGHVIQKRVLTPDIGGKMSTTAVASAMLKYIEEQLC